MTPHPYYNVLTREQVRFIKQTGKIANYPQGPILGIIKKVCDIYQRPGMTQKYNYSEYQNSLRLILTSYPYLEVHCAIGQREPALVVNFYAYMEQSELFQHGGFAIRANEKSHWLKIQEFIPLARSHMEICK